jgi:tRNA 2-thiouridine synthesizing protein A
MQDEILVDARWLEPPEPMEKVMQAVERLLPRQSIRLLLHREPYPLYVILENRGYCHTSRLQPDGTYEIHIMDASSVPNEESRRNT